MKIDAPTFHKFTIPEKLPFLEFVCWQTENVYRLTPEQMLNRYERAWRYRQQFGYFNDEELKFIKKIAKYYHSWLETDL